MEALAGRVALVTGASRGIGAAVSRSLSGAEARVALVSRSGDDLGLPNALGIACDVRDYGAVEQAVTEAVDRFGRLDILVPNAGVGVYHAFEELTLADVDEMIDVNAKGTIYAVKAALPHLEASGEADIVTLASEAGRRGLPGEAVYCASKFAQVGFTRSLDHDLRERGIRCTNVCPGGVATDFALGRGRSESALAGMMSADDVAEAVMFVLTRPRNHRILEVAFRPMGEQSSG